MDGDSVLAPVYVGYAIIAYLFRCLKLLWPSSHPFHQQNICVVNNEAECQVLALKLIANIKTTRVVGFDCEWVGNNNVALLQLASLDGLCVLVRLCKLKHIPVELKALLEDNTVLKVGVASLDDAKNLRNGYGINMQGCLDLRHLVINPMNLGGLGLASLTKNILGIELDKRKSVRCSNWEADELDLAQLEYAARDALSAAKIFAVLARRQMSSRLADRLKYSLRNPSWSEIVTMCGKYLDTRYCNKPARGSPARTNNKSPGGLSMPRYMTLKNPHYDNCWILAPDGMKLSTCCRRKVAWYVKKGLGEVVSDDPVTVQLFFEPSSRAADGKSLYNLQVKVNQCVVCGVTDSLLRKKVIPQEYKKYLPLSMIEHITHDVLLLCTKCHQVSNFNDDRFKKTLEEMTFDEATARSVVEGRTYQRDIKRVQMAARALLSHREKIPADRCVELERQVLDYYEGRTELTVTMLEDVLTLEVYVANEGYQPHACRIVEKFQAGPGLVSFQEMWREHFIRTMRPRFLPPLWSVTHNRELEDSDIVVESLHEHSYN